MREIVSYLLYFAGFWYALFNLSDVMVKMDNGETIYRPPEYAAIVIAVSLVVYFIFRDAAAVIKGKKITEE